VALVPLAAGCATAGPKTKQGALLGAAIGAGSGMIIGHQTGDRGPGGVIGAGLGALAGGLIGNAMDRADADNEARVAEAEATLREARAAQARLSILDVIRLSQAGVSDSVIIAKIDQSGSRFDLSASDIIDLKKSGVSEKVIEHMLRRSGARHGVKTAPVRRTRVTRITSYSTAFPPIPIRLGVGCHYHHR
jgi:hypothetical protein